MALNIGELVGTLGIDAGGFDEGLDKAREKLSGFKVKGAALAAAAGIGIAGALTAAAVAGMDFQGAQAKLSAQLRLTGPESARLGKVAGSLFAGNYGDSIETVNEAIRSVVTNIGGMRTASSTDLQAVSADVLSLADTFDQDLGGVTRAVGTMLRTGVAKDAKSALDVITVGFQSGANSADDLLDTFNEYSTQFRKLGLDGTGALGLIQQGLKGGARDADLVADAMKEFSIRAVDGSTTSAAGFKALGLNAKQMTTQIAEGGPAAQRGLDTVLDRLRAMKDPVKQSAAAVALFGTQAEDLGQALYSLDPTTAVKGLGQVAGAADQVNKTVGATAASNLESFKRQMQVAFVQTLGGKVLPAVTTTARVLAADFGPAVDAVSGALGNLGPVLSAVGGFLSEHQTTVHVLAGLIAAVFVPALVSMGVQATISGAQSAAGWLVSQTAAVASAAAQGLAMARTVAGWIAMGAAAIASGAETAAIWALYQAQALAGAAGQGLAVARVVGGWVLMGVQSMLQAARMAAAWFIALGPVGWVIAAIVGIVVLIVTHWSTVKRVTLAVWSWVWEHIKSIAGFLVKLFMNFTLPGLIMKHWDTIRNATTAAWGAIWGFIKAIPGKLVNIFLNWTLPGLLIKHWSSIRTGAVNGFNAVVTYVTGIPGRLVHALGNLGSLLLSAGGDLMRGFAQGIRNSAGEIITAVKNAITDKLPAFVRKALDIRSPSRVFAALGRWTGLGFAQGVAGTARAAQDAMRTVVAPPPIPRPRPGGRGGSPAAAAGSLASGDLGGAHVEVTIHEAQQTSAVEVLNGLRMAWSLLPQGV